jgi:hypothetical protein
MCSPREQHQPNARFDPPICPVAERRPSDDRGEVTSPHLTVVKNPRNVDILDRLTKLSALKQAGFLTTEQFETKLAELRSRLTDW